MPIHQTNIVGARFRKGGEARLAAMTPGTRLTLEPDPTNPFDPDAVKVMDGEQVGFIPRDFAPQIGRLIDQGRVEFVAFRGGTKIEIHYTDQTEAA